MIKFVDLNVGHKKVEKKIIKNINKILSNKKFILGDEVRMLEKTLSEYIKSKCISVSSGTVAILLAQWQFK